MHGQRYCSLHLTLGRQEACPESACAFWEDGGAVVGPGCVLERVRVELQSRPDVARWLLTLRRELEQARDEQDLSRVRSALNEVLPPGLHE